MVQVDKFHIKNKKVLQNKGSVIEMNFSDLLMKYVFK